MSKSEIISYYANLCKEHKHLLTREEYRALNPLYLTGEIEALFGNWTKFVKCCPMTAIPRRFTDVISFDKKVDRVVITFVHDGTPINIDFLNTLKNYCKHTKSELGILWGKALTRGDYFTDDVYTLLKDYLATEFIFDRDKTCIAKDYYTTPSQKNPLLNTDKVSTNIKTLIVGSTKQYLTTLPYKQYTSYRVAMSTGTLSYIDYKETVSASVDAINHTFGAIVLEWNDGEQRYVARQLQYINDCICDLDMVYTETGCTKSKGIPALVMGDLHLPEEDADVMSKTADLIKKLSPKTVVLHDVASWSSISHHEARKYLTKLQNETAITTTLATELKEVVNRLTKFTQKFPKVEFKIVHSNHDCFVDKWLNEGEFIKDSRNARLGAELFIKYLDKKSILSDYLPSNVKELPWNKSFNIKGYELSEHGDSGISGSKGSPRQFSRGFEHSVTGHTHMPIIFEKAVVVGTSSKLILNYNQKGMTCWAHTHAIIHNNGSFQLIFV